MENKTNWKDLFLLVALVVVWGTNSPVNKAGLAYTSAINFIEVRQIVAAAVLFLLVLATKNLVLPRKVDLPLLTAVGFFEMGLAPIFATMGLAYVGAGEAAFLAATTPLWIIPITAVLKREVTLLNAIGFLACLAGTILLVDPPHIRWSDPNTWLGEGLLILSALWAAVGIVATYRMTWYRPPAQLIFWQALVAAVVAVVFGFFMQVSLIPDSMHPTLVGSVLYTAIAVVALGFWFKIPLNQRLIPGIIAFGLLWIPILSLVFSAIFLHEPLTPKLLASVSLILLGMILHIVNETRQMRLRHA